MTTKQLPTDEDWVEAMDYPWPTGPYIPHEPTVPQEAFLWYQGLEALYGGAAGGGKSDALLMAALQYVDVPGYAAILLRKTYTELMLENALLDRSMKWLAHTDAGWNGENRRWTFPSGATVSFGYLQRPQDRARYQSAEFQYIGFDELTAFEETDFRFMFSRLRKVKDAGVPTRMRAATNPGGPGHKWVKARFIIPFQEIQRGDRDYNPDRLFVPARLDDNPHIDQASYRQALFQLEPELAAQFLEGDWDVREPGHWMLRDPRWIDSCAKLGERLWELHKSGERPLPPPRVEHRGRVATALQNTIDWGEYTQGYVIWPLPNGGIFVPPSEVVTVGADPVVVAKQLMEIALGFEYPLKLTTYDAAGIQSMRTYLGVMRRLPRYQYLWSRGISFKEYKKETIGYLRSLARRSYQGEQERILAIHPQNERLLDQLRRWQRKNEESDDAVKKDDHGPDALVAGVAPTAREYRRYVEKELIEVMNEDTQAYEVGVEEAGGVSYARN